MRNVVVVLGGGGGRAVVVGVVVVVVVVVVVGVVVRALLSREIPDEGQNRAPHGQPFARSVLRKGKP